MTTARTFGTRALASAVTAAALVGGLVGNQLSSAAAITQIHLQPGDQVLVIADVPTPGPTLAPTGTPTPTLAPTPGQTASPSPIVTPSSSPPPATGCYGSCINADTKANLQVGWTDHQRVAHRFRASTTSTIASIRWQQRGGPIYSSGTGGTLRVTVQPDVSGVPSGTILGAATYGPKNPSGGIFDAVTLSAPVTAGSLYEVVFDDVDANPVANYQSVNELFVYGATLAPRQPRFPDSDYAVLVAAPTTWAVQRGYTADMDITYADGIHDGLGYVQNMVDKFGTISGSATVREHFTPTATRTISQVAVRVRRSSGADPLTISLRAGTTTLGSGTVAATSIPASAAGGDNGGSVWATVSFPAVTLNAGTTYDLVLSTAAGSTYTAAPIREGIDTGFAASLGFPDGSGQSCAGSACADLYPFSPVDLQWWAR